MFGRLFIGPRVIGMIGINQQQWRYGYGSPQNMMVVDSIPLRKGIDLYLFAKILRTGSKKI